MELTTKELTEIAEQETKHLEESSIITSYDAILSALKEYKKKQLVNRPSKLHSIRKKIANKDLQKENIYLRISLKNSMNSRSKMIGRIRLANTYFEALEKHFEELLMIKVQEGQMYKNKIRSIRTYIHNGLKTCNHRGLK